MGLRPEKQYSHKTVFDMALEGFCLLPLGKSVKYLTEEGS